MYQQTQNLINTKMMNHFRSYNDFMTIMFFIIFFVLGAPAKATGHRNFGNSLVELPSDELISVAGYGVEKLSTVLVGGSVLCDACLDENSPIHPHPVPGASVAVACHTSRKTRKSNWVRGMTDQYGDFLLDLPSHLHAIPNLEKRCLVRILELPKSSPCHQAFTGKHKGIKLSSVENGVRSYTAHGIHLTPKRSQPCTNEQRRGKKMVNMF